MAVTGLGHVGIFVRDLERMVAFYRDFLGLRVTKQNWRAGVVFLSANPTAADHEIALVRGRPEVDPPQGDPHLIQQISFSVASLNDVREFHRRLVRDGYRIQRVVNHASAIGCYFYDPEGNCAEVFWVTGRPSWVPVSVPIDLEQPDDAILAEVEKLWRKVRHVGMGERMADEPATLKMNY
jgi:catechol 2,3-dioxygenase-like lactoylglutathione lyase family enzyme